MSPGAKRLLTALKRDDVYRNRMTKRSWAIVKELEELGHRIQVENPLHEGFIIYFMDKK